MHDETAIFVHIPKTAGTTIHHIIDRQYPQHVRHWIKRHNIGVEEFKSQSPAYRAQLRMVRGHIPYGLHEYIPGPATYFTILRQPIERLVSYYYFVRREPEHYLHDYANTQGVTLQRYVESRASLQTDNFQTRLISGIWTEVGYGECDQETLALAKHNLAEHFAVVGLTDQFDETLLLLKHAFSWRNVFYRRQNVTQGRPRREMLSAETLAVLREHNQLDLDLYAYAKELFKSQVREQGASFALAVRTFQNVNRWIHPLLGAYWQARRISVRTWLQSLWADRSSRDENNGSSLPG
jgi:hypothetical protein